MEQNELTDEQRLEQATAFIKSNVEAHLTALASEGRLPRNVETVDKVSDLDEGKRQLADVIKPIVSEDINRANFNAANAIDENRFYRKNPDAQEYEEFIEKRFKELADAGRPISRDDIYSHLQGQEYRKDKDKFIDKQLEHRKQQQERAQYAGDISAGSAANTRTSERFKDFDSKSVEDMEKALDGVIF